MSGHLSLDFQEVKGTKTRQCNHLIIITVMIWRELGRRESKESLQADLKIISGLSQIEVNQAVFTWWRRTLCTFENTVLDVEESKT